jgi:hypothetical protein
MSLLRVRVCVPFICEPLKCLVTFRQNVLNPEKGSSGWYLKIALRRKLPDEIATVAVGASTHRKSAQLL